MHPELIPGLPLKTYGCFMALGFILAWKLLAFLARRQGRNPEPLSNLLISLMVAGVLGARIAYVVEHWRVEFASSPLDVFRIWNGGLMFYGGLVLAMAVFFAWCLWRREKVLAVADLLAAALPLGHAFGRVGCFFYGCCYGKLSSGPLAVSFPVRSPAWHEQLSQGLIPATAGASLPVLPTQLFEAVALFALAALLARLHLKFSCAIRGLVTGVYFAAYALLRFGMEYLRGDPRAAVGPLSIGQTISLALLLAGISVIALAFFRRKL